MGCVCSTKCSQFAHFRNVSTNSYWVGSYRENKIQYVFLQGSTYIFKFIFFSGEKGFFLQYWKKENLKLWDMFEALSHSLQGHRGVYTRRRLDRQTQRLHSGGFELLPLGESRKPSVQGLPGIMYDIMYNEWNQGPLIPRQPFSWREGFLGSRWKGWNCNVPRLKLNEQSSSFKSNNNFQN